MMEMQRHGLSIGFSRIEKDIFLTFKAQGKLTHDDYEIITPMIDSALLTVKDAKVNVVIDVTELEGWELRAAWDDLKLGLRHDNDFDKIAIFGNKNWQEKATKVVAWFASGEIKYFNDQQDALTWLIE